MTAPFLFRSKLRPALLCAAMIAFCLFAQAAPASDHSALIERLVDSPEDKSTQEQAWTLLKERRLDNDQIAVLLDHAFHLIVLGGGDDVWWVFDRRSAPEFVYIQPRAWDLRSGGELLQKGEVDSTGNGVEVHAESSGRGPFAWGETLTEAMKRNGYEFRVHYEVTYAPKMEWLEGFQHSLLLRVPGQDSTVIPSVRSGEGKQVDDQPDPIRSCVASSPCRTSKRPNVCEATRRCFRVRVERQVCGIRRLSRHYLKRCR